MTLSDFGILIEIFGFLLLLVRTNTLMMFFIKYQHTINKFTNAGKIIANAHKPQTFIRSIGILFIISGLVLQLYWFDQFK